MIKFCYVLFSRTAGLRHQYGFAALFFLHAHVKMIVLGSR